MVVVEGVLGVVQGVIQGVKYVVSMIKVELVGVNLVECELFQYFDKGLMVMVLRFLVVVKIGFVEFSGFIVWLIWLVLYLVYLIGFKIKIIILLLWMVIFFSICCGQLIIIDQQVFV